MECNKDEAERAKGIAERKFMEKDYAGAKKFALKAQSLYPPLEGVSQMVTTFEVYISAENKINGEIDCYAILGVDPLADDENVRKQYRRFALMLHPDKNKSKGAEGAFKLVSEAWSILSDKAKRLAYNQRRNIRFTQQKFPPAQSKVPSQPSHANGFQTSRHHTTSTARAMNSNVRVEPTTYTTPQKPSTAPSQKPSATFPQTPSAAPPHKPSTAPPQKPSTFWTICNGCKTQYEYLRIYLNQTLLCPNCREAFLAVEKAPPPNVLKSSNWSSHHQHQSSRHQAPNRNTFNPGHQPSDRNTYNPGLRPSDRNTYNPGHQPSNRNTFRPGHQASNGNAFNPSRDSAGFNSCDASTSPWSSLPGTGSINSRTASFTTAAQAASVVQQAHDNVRRELEESWVGAEWNASKRTANSAFRTEMIFKKPRVEDTPPDTSRGSMARAMGTGSAYGSSSSFASSAFGATSMHSFTGFYGKPNTMRDIPAWELRRLLANRARKDITNKLDEFRLAGEARLVEKEKAGQKNMMIPKSKVDSDEQSVKKTSEFSKSDDTTDDLNEGLESVTISVPDPDFHNFDLDRAESSFAEDQVWAAYDDDDGMPRFYARIHSVISVNPFKLKISWLNSRSTNELGPMDWLGCGFSKTCGDFRTGKPEISDSLNSFSHKVDYTKGTRGVIHIFPKKGDVWAVYRNWSFDWDENTPDDVIHKYDMVEVLDDYNDEQGVRVRTLMKVPGFKTVFRRHKGPEEVQIIPRNEMFRLSHQIPYYTLTGQEAPNAPQACLELDPAATPLDLIEIAPEVSGKSQEETLQDSPEVVVVKETLKTS